MRLTKENFDKYLNKYGGLDLYNNKEITHIDYIHDNIKTISIYNSNVVEITCKLPDGLKIFYCNKSKLKSLPLLPKTLFIFNAENSNIPNEFQVYIGGNNNKCNQLRKLQLLELI